MTSKQRKYTIGIDIGGTKILVGLLDDSFRLIAEVKDKTKTEKGEHNFLKTVTECVKTVVKEANVDRRQIVGIGVGCPGFVNPQTGQIAFSPNIPFLKNYPLAMRLSRLLKRPVVVGNDVQTGLYGEFAFGAAQGYRNVVGIFLGTGIGGAMILNGRPYLGASGSAGEVGHLLLDPSGPLCGCGHNGCFEAYAGRLAIASEAAVIAVRQQAPKLAQKAGTDLRAIKSGMLAKSIDSGDRVIEQLMLKKAGIVGRMMADLVNLLNPDLIVLGGGLTEAMPGLIVKEAERVMRRLALKPLAQSARVAVAKLGDHSVVMGAAKKAADRFLERRTAERRG